MTEINPYAAPTSTLVTPPSETSSFVPNGRTVSAGHGYHWMIDGFRLFFKVPVHFYILMVAHFFAFILVLVLVPFIGGFLINVMLPMFTAGYFAVGDALKKTTSPDVSVMFTGFSKKPTQLLTIGAVGVGGHIIAFVVGGLVGGGPALYKLVRGGDYAAAFAGGVFEMQMLIGALVMLALIIPVSMAVWLSPALVVLHDVAPIEAMKQSFNACLKNFVPYLVYGVVSFVAIVAGCVPLLLGLLVVIPALAASVYPQYVSIFAADGGK